MSSKVSGTKKISPSKLAKTITPSSKKQDESKIPQNQLENEDSQNHHIKTGPSKADPKAKKRTYSPKELWKNNIFAPSSVKAPPKDIVSKKLTLEYTHGYRIAKCRHNLFSVFNLGHHYIAYPIAGLVTLLNLDQKKQSFFTKHSDDVVALTFNAATGNFASGEVGKNPAVHIWNISWPTRSISCLKPGQIRSIASLAFSYDGSLLVVVGDDDDNTVFVYEWEESNTPKFESRSSQRILDSCFIGANEFVTVGERHIRFWKIENNQLTSSNGIFGDVSNIRTLVSVACMADGTVVTGSILGDILFWDNGIMIHAIPNAHGSTPTYALQAYMNGFVSGGADGKIQFWDNDSNLVNTLTLEGQVRTISYQGTGSVIAGLSDSKIIKVNTDGSALHNVVSGHNGMNGNELWGLAVNPVVKDQFVTCSEDNFVKIWILFKSEPLRQGKVVGKAKTCEISPDGKRIIVGTEEGNVHILDYSNMKTLFTLYDSKENISDIKYSPDGSFVAVASMDNEIRLYSTTMDPFKLVKILHGHTSFVTHIDWSLNGKYIQSNSGDNELLFWNVEKGGLEKKPIELKDIPWATSTCCQTWPMLGIWDTGLCGNDINSVDSNQSKTIIALGDDFGNVKVFNYPAIANGPNVDYTGHSSHVTNVRFTKDGSHLISIGGADNAILQWSVS